MSAAANAAAFLSMRRRLPEEAAAKTHFQRAPALAAPRSNPVRVAVLNPAPQLNPVQVSPVQVSYRKRRSILK